MQWSDPRPYGAILAILCFGVWLIWIMVDRTRIRLWMAAVRADEDAARSVGINVTRVKLGSFIASAIVGGLAGVFYAQFNFIVTPEGAFGLDISMTALIVCLLGGIGRPAGSVIGAAILIPLTALLDYRWGNTAGGSRLALGFALIGVVLFAPNGILGLFERSGHGRRAQAAPSPQEQLEEQLSPTARPTAPRSGGRDDVQVGEVVLEARDIHKQFGGVRVLEGVDLQVRRGEFVGLVGPNGAGKSTLFDILTGYQHASEGHVEVGGTRMRSGRPFAAARLGLRRTFQTSKPFTGLTALENVLASCKSSQASVDADVAARRLLADVGLAHVANVPADSLSPAEMRLLEVARALAGDPEVLLLDEPLAGLTDEESEVVLQVLWTQQGEGRTIVLVDHDVSSVARWVGRLLLLDGGTIVADGAPNEVLGMEIVKEAYLGNQWQPADD
jgi:branched-chain amino acid transport system permease protein